MSYLICERTVGLKGATTPESPSMGASSFKEMDPFNGTSICLSPWTKLETCTKFPSTPGENETHILTRQWREDKSAQVPVGKKGTPFLLFEFKGEPLPKKKVETRKQPTGQQSHWSWGSEVQWIFFSKPAGFDSFHWNITTDFQGYMFGTR